MARSTSRSSLLLLALLAAPACAEGAGASDRLLYLEAQAVGGYDSARDKAVFYSIDQREVMQKPGVGLDAVQKLSTHGGDLGTVAVQGRLALDAEGTRTLEPQLYNAYFKLKAPASDIWVGHDRPALGIASYLDSHGLLLQPLAMEGYGFDRDWGVGTQKDLSWGDIRTSFTTGSGMSLHLDGGWLASARTGLGVLSRDNHAVGLSVARGKTLDVMGYHVMPGGLRDFTMGGADAALLWNQWEGRFEVLGGERLGQPAYGLLWRLGLNLGEESQLKLEAQPELLRTGTDISNKVAAGVTYLISGDLTWRAMYQYDNAADGHRVLTQLYYYFRL
ncbi:MAG: hypothetical protein NTY77_04195 [Elusimicrobia bacterium]|nr:hypothetical protein [Elusimicrobiota bacterium]